MVSDGLGRLCNLELPGDAGPGSGGLLGHLLELGFLLHRDGVDKAGFFDNDSAYGVLARGSRLDGFILLILVVVVVEQAGLLGDRGLRGPSSNIGGGSDSPGGGGLSPAYSLASAVNGSSGGGDGSESQELGASGNGGDRGGSRDGGDSGLLGFGDGEGTDVDGFAFDYLLRFGSGLDGFETDQSGTGDTGDIVDTGGGEGSGSGEPGQRGEGERLESGGTLGALRDETEGSLTGSDQDLRSRRSGVGQERSGFGDIDSGFGDSNGFGGHSWFFRDIGNGLGELVDGRGGASSGGGLSASG